MIQACENFILSIGEEINLRYSVKSEEFSRRVKDKKKQIIKPDDEQNKLAHAMSVVSEVILNELSSCFNLIITELEESFKKKKEDSDWEGFEEKFKKYQKAICRVFRS